MMHRAALLLPLTALALVVAACSDSPPPIGPAFPESGLRYGAVGVDSVSDTIEFTASRTARLPVTVCGPVGATFGVAVVTDAGRDTVGRGTAASGCASLDVASSAQARYRFVVRALSGRGTFVACWAYDASRCTGLAARPATPAGQPVAYWIAAEGLRDTALLRALSLVVRGQPGFLYDSARGWMYQDVEDPDDDNVITDLYVGRSATVDRRASSATDAGDAGFNAEHAWPQSCGARTDAPQGPRGDLHVIYAADATANQQRGNFPFGVVTGTPTWTSTPPVAGGEVSRLGRDAQGRTVFEPRPSRRGDIARALLYYYVRYVVESPAGQSLANFNVEEPVLRQWAQADPVDVFERARHEEAFRVQGNRNPFVDRPDFLEAVTDFPSVVAGTAASCNF